MPLKKHPIILILTFVFIAFSALDVSAFYKVNRLSGRDAVFQEFVKDISYTTKYINFRRRYTEDNLHLLKDLPKLKLALYTVKTEDTIFSIAEKTGLSVDTIISVNSFGGEFYLKKGDRIIIPNMKGIMFKFPRRISLEKVSRLYGISAYILKRLNNVRRNVLYENEELFIPSGRLSISELDVFLQRRFVLPLMGRLTSRYGRRLDPFRRGVWSFHPGIDIAARMGAPVKAAARGKVIFAGWKGGYGLAIIIEHSNGYTTYYGHLRRGSIKVRPGQIVRPGDIIAGIGMTGMTTGPHLHFEVRRYGNIKNPLKAIKLPSMAALYR